MRFVELGFVSRIALAVIAGTTLVACSFHKPDGSQAGSGDDDGDDGSGGDDDTTMQVGCHNDKDRAVLCVDFEDASLATTAADHSLGGPNNVALTSVDPTDHGDEQAALLTKDSTLLVAETPTLDFSNNWTLEMFVFADPLPKDGGPGGGGPLLLPGPPPVYWMFNNNNEYGMELKDDGTVRCVIGSKTVDSIQKVTEKTWTHVACVFNGGKLHVFVDGTSTECMTSGAAPTIGDDGSAIGGNIGAGGRIDNKFLGAIDNIALYGDALASSRICELAGKTGCEATCGAVPF